MKSEREIPSWYWTLFWGTRPTSHDSPVPLKGLGGVAARASGGLLLIRWGPLAGQRQIERLKAGDRADVVAVARWTGHGQNWEAAAVGFRRSCVPRLGFDHPLSPEDQSKSIHA